MKGRAGSFSFYSSKGRQVARVAQNSSNYGESARRSEAQQKRRVKWANLVNMYKLMAGTLHGAFETKRPNETDYNAFMRKNIPVGTVALTKEQAALGCCVPQAFLLSEGSLFSPSASFNEEPETGAWEFGIVMDEDMEWDGETVKRFTESVLDNNSWAKEGMQISIIAVSCSDDADAPRSLVERYELTLSTKDTRLVKDVFGALYYRTSRNGWLTSFSLSGDSYVAIIISDSTSGKLKVSTSSLNPGDKGPENEFSTDVQVRAAMESYGLDPARFLDSGDYE